MKKIIFVFTFITVNFVYAFCGGIHDKELVNMQEIELVRFDEIEIQYRSEEVTIFSDNSDKFILKEYMTENKSSYFAKITNSGNKLIIEAGQRPLFNIFRARIEVYIPVSNKNITIKTSSGSIKAAGEYKASLMKIESSSGIISVNSITADRINFKTSSGSINCQNANGNSIIETSSGSIVCSIINGDLSAKSSSGKIALDQVSGSLNTTTRSGDIHTGKTGENADIHTRSGSIVAGGVNGIAILETSSGSIHCLTTENARDLKITTSSGGVILDIPRNSNFNFSSRSSSGRLNTPFSDKLFTLVSDRNNIQGIIDGNNVSKDQITNNISIRTSSGSIRVNWID
jgi:hypothetical protein